MLVSPGSINLFLVSPNIQTNWTCGDIKNNFMYPNDNNINIRTKMCMLKI